VKDYIYNKYDVEAAKIIDDFLPDKVFDVHAHISHIDSKRGGRSSFDMYYEDMKLFMGSKKLLCNGIIFPDKEELKNVNELQKSDNFLISQLEKYPENVGEIIILPHENAEDIKKRLTHERIRGLKCYHVYAGRTDTMNADICEFLPESAWEIAAQRKMAITLHMVKDEALADSCNLQYIKDMAKKYPDVCLILAHAARAFAAWTVFDTVDELKFLENVMYDFSGICESPSMQYIIKTVGCSRCMWGSDYPISMFSGKAISLGSSFYWISGKDIEKFSVDGNLKTWHVGTENLMAVRQACILADVSKTGVEDIFYNNAHRIFK